MQPNQVNSDPRLIVLVRVLSNGQIDLFYEKRKYKNTMDYIP